MTVYCVFYLENGAAFLEGIFEMKYMAESYVSAQGRYANSYRIETWEVV